MVLNILLQEELISYFYDMPIFNLLKPCFISNISSCDNPDICFKLFGEEKINLMNNLNEGDEINVFFNLSSREWNGKWFTYADAWKIEKSDSEFNQDTIDDSDIPVFENNQTEEDDLPF